MSDEFAYFWVRSHLIKRPNCDGGQFVQFGRNNETMGAKLVETLSTQYELTPTGDLKPTNGGRYILQLRDSKHLGFPRYLQLRATGQPRPLFLSSIYEPRTPDGLWNVEIERKRLEARRTPTGGIELYPIARRSSQVTPDGQDRGYSTTPQFVEL